MKNRPSPASLAPSLHEQSMLSRGKSANYPKRAILIITAILALFANFPLHAQQSQMADLSAQVASALEKANIKGKVVILDFSGPGLEVTQVGRNLADQLFDAMPKAAKKFTIVDRNEMFEALRRDNPSFSASSDIDPGRVLPLTHADIEILGHLEKTSDSISLKLEIRRIKKMKTVAKFAESLSVSSETTAQISKVISSSEYAEAGAIGYTRPDCLHCPIPPYSDAALRSRAEGPIVLSVLIEPDGRAHDISIQKHLRADLDNSAITAVADWTFKPAIGPDGQPATVKMLIEIDFHLQ